MSRLNVIFSKFDEVQRSGNMVLSPVSGKTTSPALVYLIPAAVTNVSFATVVSVAPRQFGCHDSIFLFLSAVAVLLRAARKHQLVTPLTFVCLLDSKI